VAHGVLSDVQGRETGPAVDDDSMDGKYDWEVFYRMIPEILGF